MGEGVNRWADSRRAWERLTRWFAGSELGGPRRRHDGDAAVEALADIGLVRRLLEHAEFEAVRAARRDGRSWAEIATSLGVTRQSAWERWRDVDEPSRSGVSDSGSDEPRTSERDRPSIVAEVGAAAHELVGRSARGRHRRSPVTVPNVVGTTWAGALATLHAAGLVALSVDTDGLPLAVLDGTESVIIDQSPESGAKVPQGSAVRLWIERDGGAGVREPLHPRPSLSTGRKLRPEPSDQAAAG
jgi:hypothetical protein